MAGLKPCPFCGGKANVHTGVVADISMILCNVCGATVSFQNCKRKSHVEIMWNMRSQKNTDNNYSEIIKDAKKRGVPQEDIVLTIDFMEKARKNEEIKRPMHYLCPRCKNERHPKDASFCLICGLKIENQKH